MLRTLFIRCSATINRLSYTINHARRSYYYIQTDCYKWYTNIAFGDLTEPRQDWGKEGVVFCHIGKSLRPMTGVSNPLIVKLICLIRIEYWMITVSDDTTRAAVNPIIHALYVIRSGDVSGRSVLWFRDESVALRRGKEFFPPTFISVFVFSRRRRTAAFALLMSADDKKHKGNAARESLFHSAGSARRSLVSSSLYQIYVIAC